MERARDLLSSTRRRAQIETSFFFIFYFGGRLFFVRLFFSNILLKSLLSFVPFSQWFVTTRIFDATR